MNDQFRALDCFKQAIGKKYHLFEFKALPLVYFVLALTIDQINKVFLTITFGAKSMFPHRSVVQEKYAVSS